MEFDRQQVMGILNVTPDSFYAGSRTADETAVRVRVERMLAEGVDIIDIGACSTRPGAASVDADEELRRLDMGMRVLRAVDANIPVSVDTFRSSVAKRAVADMGADIVNDISGGKIDPDMWGVVADLKAPYIIMHCKGTPETMMNYTDYDNVVADVIADLAAGVHELNMLGVADVIIDPGFGFSKTTEQNYRLMQALPMFEQLGRPLLVGVSRKSMITRPLGLTPDSALPGTVALGTLAVACGGASILRVHDVAAARQSIEVARIVADPDLLNNISNH